MGNRRFTRLTNGFSKRVANHAYQVALYVVYHNFVRIHQTLRMTPAMATGVTDTLYDMDWLVELVERHGIRSPGRRGRTAGSGRSEATREEAEVMRSSHGRGAIGAR